MYVERMTDGTATARCLNAKAGTSPCICRHLRTVDRAGTNEATRREVATTTSEQAADNSQWITHLAKRAHMLGRRDSTRFLDARVRETAAGAEAQGMKWRPNRRDVGRMRT
jgi:hypothetical protein